MPVIDILSAALSGPAGRVVEGPVRTLVAEVLQDRGYASPAEVQALRDDLGALRDQLGRLSAEVETLRAEATDLRAEVGRLHAVAAAGPRAVPERAVPERAVPQRHGMSLEEYERWRAGGLPGRIGPDGYVEVDGVACRVDAALAGRPYTLSKHKSPRILVDGQVVERTPVA